ATFDWPKIDQLADIRQAQIGYKLERVEPDAATGTNLEIRQLKTSTDFASNSSLRSDVLRIVTPLQGLDPGKFKPDHRDSKTDPGFRVILPGEGPEGTDEINLADLVLSNYWGRLRIELKGKNLKFEVWFSSSKTPKPLEVTVSTAISSGFVAD